MLRKQCYMIVNNNYIILLQTKKFIKLINITYNIYPYNKY